MLNYIPKYFTDKAIYLYIGLLFVVSFTFMNYTMAWYWYIFGLIAVVSFFYFSNELTRKWSCLLPKTFTTRLFIVALIIRIVWVVFSYFFYINMTGLPFEFGAADVISYHAAASDLATRGFEYYESALYGMALSDRGYPTYLGIVYMLTGQSILIARLIKALFSAFTCVLIYRLSSRNFGDSVGRMAAIFCMLMPNLIYYCGLHLKETEMLFLTVAFVERADYAMRSAKMTSFNIILPIILAGSLFFFRTVLGATALFAFVTALFLSSSRSMKKGGRRIMLLVWVIIAVGYFMGGRIATEIEEVWEKRTSSQQESMQWRAQREGGNEFAKYASGAMFAPMIVVIPFPTMVSVTTQYNQQMLHGGYYVKNILVFFAMFALFWLIRSGKWRDHILIGSFTIGYLMVIALSAFVHSERFHLPVLPFLLIFAACGVSLQTNKSKKYFNWWLAFIFVAVVGWSWFKLAGRGLM